MTVRRVGVLAAVFVAQASLIQAAVLPVHEFVDLQLKWPEFARTKARLIVVGRYSSRAGNIVKLYGCPLTFQPESGKNLPAIRGRDSNVEFTGFITGRGTRFKFIVERMRETPSDLERLADRRSRLPTRDYEAWYALAREGLKTAEFYDDRRLHRESLSIFRHGLDGERRTVDKEDPVALRKLAAKIREFDPEDSTSREMIHEALHLQWRRARRQEKPDYAGVLKQIAVDFPKAIEPLRKDDPVSRQRYLQSPISTYGRASDGMRRQLQRILYSEIQLQQILLGANSDGSNGELIAAAIVKQIPELSGLADGHRQRQHVWAMSQVESLTLPEMQEFVSKLTAEKKHEDVIRVHRRWLKAREVVLTPRGPAGLLEAANLYRDVMRDTEKEISLLQKAWELLEPKSVEQQHVTQRLTILGWVRDDDRWKPVESIRAERRRQDPGTSLVALGMEPNKVRKSLGSPTSRARVATLGEISDIWVYSEAGLVVRFRRGATGTAKVVSVTSLAR